MNLTSTAWRVANLTAPFAVFQDAAKSLFGSSPSLQLVHENKTHPFAHEAGVFFPQTNSLFITSNQFKDPASGSVRIVITRVTLSNGTGPVHTEEVHTDHVPMANGGVNYKDGMLLCAQGTKNSSGGLSFMQPRAPYKSELLLTGFHGRDFNSVNDVVVHADGSVWFTDPIYGFEQGLRPQPRLPSQVYRWDPARKSVRPVADGFGRPNGIAFSPDQKTLYVTDTDWIHGDGSKVDTRVSSIYAFDVTDHGGQPSLTNRRLFAMADTGAPDGIKCDVHGNVYAGCGDGISVWSAGGELLGKILIKGGAANFAFGRNGEMFIMNEHKLWRAQLAQSTKGALLNI